MHGDDRSARVSCCLFISLPRPSTCSTSSLPGLPMLVIQNNDWTCRYAGAMLPWFAATSVQRPTKEYGYENSQDGRVGDVCRVGAVDRVLLANRANGRRRPSAGRPRHVCHFISCTLRRNGPAARGRSRSRGSKIRRPDLHARWSIRFSQGPSSNGPLRQRKR